MAHVNFYVTYPRFLRLSVSFLRLSVSFMRFSRVVGEFYEVFEGCW